MNSRDLLLMNLRRQDMDYQMRAREALIHVEDFLRKKDLQFGKQLLSEFVFCEKAKTGRINTTQETQLVVVLLSDFFAKDDPSKIPFFFQLFETSKNSRKFLLLKFILTGVAIQSSAALNSAGAYLLDPSTKDFRISADFGRLLINEITFFANNSIDKMKSLSILSPLFVNALCLIFAETYKDEQMATAIIGSLITDFLQAPSPAFLYTFNIPAHVEVGALIIGSFYRWSVLSELYEEKPSYSKSHLKMLEIISGLDPSALIKPIVYTKYLDNIIDQIQRAAVTKDPERVQRSVEKFAQIVQVSKIYLYGNIPLLMERLKTLPKNSLMELVILSA